MEYTGSGLQTADGLGPVDLQCCGKGIYLKSPHENIQLPYATKTRASRNLCKTNSTGCQHRSHKYFLIYIIQHGLKSIHQTYTCRGRINRNTWHYILVCSLHGLSPQSRSTSDYEKMMEYTGSSLQTADGLGPVDLQCCGKGIPQVPTRRSFSSRMPQRQSQQKSVPDKFHWMSTLFEQIVLLY